MNNKPDKVIFDGAKIRFTHFSGIEDDFNKKGDRNFTIELDQNQYEDLKARGFYVKENMPKNGGEPYYTMKVKCNWREEWGIAPQVYLVTNGRAVPMSESTVKRLDDLNILSADIVVTSGSKPWKNRQTGIEYWPAYCEIIYAVTDGMPRRRNDVFAEKYAASFTADDDTLDIATDELPF